MQKTILFLAANPKNTSKLDLKKEVAEIQKALQRLQRDEQFVFKQQWATTLEAVRHALLDHKPHIVHFSGHGVGQAGIVLENKMGDSQSVSGETLAHFFEPFADKIECVILNACFSALQATDIVKYVNFVIGMNQPIYDQAAIQFAIGFYDALAAGESIPNAFKLGRTSIQGTMQQAEEHLKPVLKQRFANTHWLMPIPKNHLFTGRQAILHQLQEKLHFRQVAVLSGLGGMGKTQTAAHYARLHRHEYQAVFWCLVDTEASLNSGLVAIAHHLDLPAKNAENQKIIIAAVKNWLATQTHWLLILDNADEVKIVGELTALAREEKRHIVLTSRAQMTEPFAPALFIPKMALDDGVTFLLHRAFEQPRNQYGVIQDYHWRDEETAEQLVEMLGALPLALDQAGAYIRETQCGLSGYLERYQRHGPELLRERGSLFNEHEHPAPIAVTWLLSFEKIKTANPIAIEVLCLCAFLHPDNIPEEVFQDLVVLELDQALKLIFQYSFVQRDPSSKILRIHRLVQTILRDEMDEATQRDWAEKAVRAVNRAFPDPDKFSNWSSCERLLPSAQTCAGLLIEKWKLEYKEAGRLLPSAQTCADLIEEWKLESEDAGCLLHKMASYLKRTKADYESAKLLYERALAIRKKVFGQEHPDVAESLNDLALLYKTQGKYDEAEKGYKRALAIRQKVLGQESLEVAESLHNLAFLYTRQAEYEEAEKSFKRSLAIKKKRLVQEHPMVANTLRGLATLYYAQGDYEKAEPLFERSLAIRKKVFEQESRTVAITLSGLATLYYAQGEYEKSKPLFEKSLAIPKKLFGQEHPDVAESLNNLALLSQAQGNDEKAKQWFEESLAIREKVFDQEHPDVAESLNNLARLYDAQGDYEQAKPLYERAIKMAKKFFKPEHPEVRLYSENYAGLLKKMKKRKIIGWLRKWLWFGKG
ncbi:MAG: tetratricopeptide repeat protein [Candidatus Parabeggiatoa sp.]|nr:tetratricopeptide repeat protein [Candidatus Parabeggiatoa sp.]